MSQSTQKTGGSWARGGVDQSSLIRRYHLVYGQPPKIFTALADAVEWIARQEGVEWIMHYLDDFLVIGALGTEDCRLAVRKRQNVLDRLGFPVAMEKLEGPSTKLTFLGFEIDMVAMEVRLPQAKLAELKELIQHWCERKVCTIWELESLVGHWGPHSGRSCRPGKTF